MRTWQKVTALVSTSMIVIGIVYAVISYERWSIELKILSFRYLDRNHIYTIESLIPQGTPTSVPDFDLTVFGGGNSLTKVSATVHPGGVVIVHAIDEVNSQLIYAVLRRKGNDYRVEYVIGKALG